MDLLLLQQRLSYLWLFAVLAFGAVLLDTAPAAAAARLLWAPQSAEANRPISIAADQITTWKTGSQQMILLRGQVLIEQGLTSLRFEEGIIWIDEDYKKKTDVYKLQLYAAGGLRAAEGPRNLQSDDGLLELRTRGAIQVKSIGRRIAQQSMPEAAIVQHGEQERQRLTRPLPAQPQVIAARPEAVRELTPTPTAPPAVGTAPAAQNAPHQTLLNHPPRSVVDASVPVNAGGIQLTGGQVPDMAPVPGPPAPFAPSPAPAPLAPPVPQGTLPGLPSPSTLPPPPGLPLMGVPVVDGKTIIIRPRSSFLGIPAQNRTLPTGETAVIISSGVIMTVTNIDGKGGVLDVEADRLVFWTRGNTQQILEDLQSARGQNHRDLEFYMSGNVEIRTQTGKELRLLRADEVYYDVNRHVAIATHAHLEIFEPRMQYPLHVQSNELFQLNQDLFKAEKGMITGSPLPHDPGVSVTVRDVTVEQRKVTRTTIFGRPFIDRATGQPIVETQRYARGRNAVLWLEDIPVFYLPFFQGDVEDPLGPLQNLTFNFSRIFGFQIYTTWDVYDLIGITARPGTQWRLDADLLTDRGPALGTMYTFAGKDMLDMPNRYSGMVRAWGLYDRSFDVIGGNRGQILRVGRGPNDIVPVDHPDFRGRFTANANVLDLPNGFQVQGQVSAISDRNFMEQYFYMEFLNQMNRNTFAYVKQQQGNWAWTGLVQPRTLPWFTRDEWYPRMDGYLLGLKFFDNLVTYNLKANAGFGTLNLTDQPPPAYLPTDVQRTFGRFDLWQEAALPFYLGPFKIEPYLIGDLSYYTSTVTGNDHGRFYGAGGVRGSLPFSRLYAGVSSELFNLNGLYHKVVFTAESFNSFSSASFLNYPQMDRLNDDATDLTLRSAYPDVPTLYPNMPFLMGYPLYNPQVMALRKQVTTAIDTRNTMEIIRVGARQRWQTKRGFPGRQHVVDWMTLDTNATFFPNVHQFNVANLNRPGINPLSIPAIANAGLLNANNAVIEDDTWTFLDYKWEWYIGDRTSLVSSGWVNPIHYGQRIFDFGANLDRPDRTSFYLGYRHIDPINTRAVIGSVSYLFSRKYAVTASANYDFGIQNQVTNVVLTRTGKDMRVSFGISYNSILNNFGVVFEIMPNIVPTGSGVRGPATPGPFNTATGGNNYQYQPPY